MMVLVTDATLSARLHLTVCKQVLFLKLNTVFSQVCNEPPSIL
jgi:hypothetical protein